MTCLLHHGTGLRASRTKWGCTGSRIPLRGLPVNRNARFRASSRGRGTSKAGAGAAATSRYILCMTRPLEIGACRSVCSWDESGERLGDERLFACGGCGSEWVTSEAWTPIDSNGAIPQAIHDERRRGRR